MELVLENPSLLKKSMEIISDIVLEATLVFKKDYMEMVALNSNNVVMVVFRLLSTNFDKYELTEEKKISLSLEHLSNVLKRCDDKAKLTMEVKDNAKLRIVSEGKNKKEKIRAKSVLIRGRSSFLYRHKGQDHFATVRRQR